MAHELKKECDKMKKGCPLRELLTRLADKWSVLIILTLTDSATSTLRFSELKRNIDGISQRMLTTTLKNLERDGLLVRKVFPEVPPRVEYTLTALGKSVLVPMQQLVGWIEGKWSLIESARKKYDQRKVAEPPSRV